MYSKVSKFALGCIAQKLILVTYSSSNLLYIINISFAVTYTDVFCSRTLLSQQMINPCSIATDLTQDQSSGKDLTQVSIILQSYLTCVFITQVEIFTFYILSLQFRHCIYLVFLFQEIAAHPKFTADGFSRFDLLQGKLGKYSVMHMHFKCQVITFAQRGENVYRLPIFSQAIVGQQPPFLASL